MLEMGFEEAIKHSQPQNLPGRTYKFQPPCCAMKYAKGAMRCTQPEDWIDKIDTALPYGNPVDGGPWIRVGEEDTGTYVGGTQF